MAKLIYVTNVSLDGFIEDEHGAFDWTAPSDDQFALVTDLVYTPLRTQFLIEAEAAGATIVDGLGMLLHQAAPGFERWFGRRPEVDDATRQAVLSA